MKRQNQIRTFVLKTNPIWPFSSLNRIPYRFAIASFVRMCKDFPEIKSIYLRHGLTEKDWIPGISDIDLTLITANSSTDEKEFEFLQRFWTNFAKMKNRFPMLGEIDILREEQTGLYTSFKIWGYEASSWKLIYGANALQYEYPQEDSRIYLDSLRHAVWFYLDYLLQRFFDTKKSAFLLSAEMNRIASKILRYANYQSKDKARNEEIPQEPVEIVSFILKRLERSTATFLMTHPGGSHKIAPDVSDPAEKVSGPNDPLIQEILGNQNSIRSVVLTRFNPNIILIEPESDPTSLRTCLESIRNTSWNAPLPVIVSPHVFEFMMRFVDPYFYTHLLNSRRIVFGEDPISKISVPEISSFTQRLLNQIPTILMFTRTQRMIIPSTLPETSKGQVAAMIYKGLFLKLLLEKDNLSFRYTGLVAESKKQYPEFCQNLDRYPHDAWESFRMLKRITSDIQLALKSDSRGLLQSTGHMK